MKEEKNHVGRPTNEEVKVRNKKKLIKAISILCVITIVVIGTIMLTKAVDTGKLEGSNRRVSNKDTATYPNNYVYLSSISGKKINKVNNACNATLNFNKIGSHIKYIRVGVNGSTLSSSRYTINLSPVSSNKKSYTDDIYGLDYSKNNNIIIWAYNADYFHGNDPTASLLYDVTYSFKVDKNCKFTKLKTVDSEYTDDGKVNNLTISCPKEVKINSGFDCTTNAKNVKISSSNKNIVDSSYSRDITNDGQMQFFVSKKTGTVTITASKTGFNSASTKVKIVKEIKKTTTKKSAKTGLKLNCPASAKVNQEFTCTTNAKGVKISVSKTNLAKGYNTSFTTTANDKTKQSKYTKTGTVTVKAELSGYKSVEKKVKIVSSTSNKTTTTKNSALTGNCSARLSAIGNYKMQYTTSCTGNAKVTNIAYQVINPSNNTAITKLINRGSGWGSYKAGTSTIVFASDRKGKKIKVRVYYDTNANSKSTSHYQDSYEILK